MDTKEKAKFIRTHCDSIRDVVISRIAHMPDDWDGIELREYLAREFSYETVLSRNPLPDKKRLRDFQEYRGD